MPKARQKPFRDLASPSATDARIINRVCQKSGLGSKKQVQFLAGLAFLIIACHHNIDNTLLHASISHW